jgi:hypothetical protein
MEMKKAQRTKRTQKITGFTEKFIERLCDLYASSERFVLKKIMTVTDYQLKTISLENTNACTPFMA